MTEPEEHRARGQHMRTPHVGLVEAAPVGLVILDRSGRVMFANPEARRITGSELTGRLLADLFVEDRRGMVRASLTRLASPTYSGNTSFAGEAVLGDGSEIWLDVRVTRVGDGAELVAVLQDQSEAHGWLMNAWQGAWFDPHTGLAGRALLMERLNAARRTGHGGSLLCLDLDDFMLFNDRHGHLVGDEVLVEVARRIDTAVPGAGTAARVGGEMFMVLLPGYPLPAAEAFAEALLATVGEPMQVAGVQATVTVSAGVADLDSPTSQDVLRNVDLAMYEAKAAGKARVCTYRPNSDAPPDSASADADQARAEELAAQARTDPLTGLGNRRAFDEALAALDATARRRARGYSVAYFDLDHCDELNRALGYEAGDATLRAVAQTLDRACRAGEVVYRTSGEMFIALLPDADLDDAVAAAERFVEAVRTQRLPAGPDRDGVTISGGVAVLDTARHPAPASVVAEANQALLLAKRAGRDRVHHPPDRVGRPDTEGDSSDT